MSDLKWTLLRHRVLRDVAADDASISFRYWPSTPGSPRAFEHKRRDLAPQEKTTLAALLNEMLILPVQIGVRTLARGLEVSAEGAVLLSRWDRDYPSAATPRPEEQR